MKLLKMNKIRGGGVVFLSVAICIMAPSPSLAESRSVNLVCAAALAAGLCTAGDYPFQAAEMTNVSIRAGFWLPRFETNRVVTVRTSGKARKRAASTISLQRETATDMASGASHSTTPTFTRSSKVPPIRYPPIPTRSSRSISTTSSAISPKPRSATAIYIRLVRLASTTARTSRAR